MSFVLFEVEFESDQMSALELPIEIRKPNAALVSRTVARQSIELEPGDYIATARLPSGSEIHKDFSVPFANDIEVKLRLEPAEALPFEPDEIRRSVDNDIAPFRIRPHYGLKNYFRFGIREYGGPYLRLRAFMGNALLGQSAPFPLDAPGTEIGGFSGSSSFEFRIKNSPVRIVQFGNKSKALNILLPTAIESRGYCRVVVNTEREPTVEVHPKSVTADALLAYAAGGFATEALTVAASKAERLLKEKLEDPIAATIGAYTLLRLGDLDALGDWTQNLFDWFYWFPDGVAILAEHLARLGKHPDAVDVLLALPTRGLPIFADGLTYVLNRLRLYISVEYSPTHLERLRIDSEKLHKLTYLLTRLQRFAKHVDFRHPVLNYTGIDPNKPEVLNR